MYPPVDYPVMEESVSAVKTSSVQKNEDMTYAALLDRYEAEEVITEAMIQSACLRIETAQQFPFASKPQLQAFSEVSTAKD